MSEQENNGLTLEGLAQRLEALERGEAGKDQTGEEPAAEFVPPASRGEQEYDGLTLLDQAQRSEALEREELARRLEVLERENASLRREVASLMGSGTGILGSLLRGLTEQEHREARGTTYFDEVRCNYLIAGEFTLGHAFLSTNGVYGRNVNDSAGVGGTGKLGARFFGRHGGILDSAPNDVFAAPEGHGMLAEGGFGVEGRGVPSGGPGSSVGVKGMGDTGVWGISTRTGYGGVHGMRLNPFHNGPGVVGDGQGVSYAGVLGSNPDGTGVLGEGSKEAETAGVRGLGKTGVWGSSSAPGRSGVYGQNTGTEGYGVVGDGSGSGGAGVLGRNGSGYGGRFEGGKAQLKLLPKEAVGKPTTGEHTKGEIYMDSEATLFVCTADGTPGTWKRFQTTPAP
jgi:hypothetical protein